MIKVVKYLFVNFILWKYVNADQDFYTAAVVEYAAQTMDTPLGTMLKNLNYYRNFTEEASKKGAQIIVFPEYGLTTVELNNPEKYAIEIPSNQSFDHNKILTEIKDIAIEHKIYVVVNLLEKATNEKGKVLYYNTNLVFSKNGLLIAKYRKMNLYLEDKLTPGNESVVFTTDFGVTFSTFICFDILYKNPSVDVLNNNKVTDIIYPTAWFSNPPFFTSLSVQHGYAMGHRVNLLAADFNNPQEANGGSGIYLADGTIATSFITGSNNSSKLLLYGVPKQSQRPSNVNSCTKNITNFVLRSFLNGDSDLTKINFKTIFEPSKYEFKKINLENLSVSNSSIYEICHKGFCCKFNISFNYINRLDHYKIMAYNGPFKIGGTKIYTKICTLLSCESDDPITCANITNPLSRLGSISVKSVVSESNDSFYRPLSLLSNLEPSQNYEFCNYINDSSRKTYTLMSHTPIDNLLSFGIIGITNSSCAITFNLIFLFLAILGILF